MDRKEWKRLGRRLTRRKIKILYICPLIFILIILIFILLRRNIENNWSIWVTIITAIGAIIQAGILAWTLHSEETTKRFEFIEEYNFHFLTSKKFQDVERKLETCYQLSKEYRNNETSFIKKCFEVFKMNPNNINSNRMIDGEIREDYQDIVNYLVYLESFVPLIIYNRIELEEIDDLYGYRYFIAVNNPVIQEMELFPYRDYYNGCFSVYERWRRFRSNKKTLSETMPLEKYDLIKRWKKYKRKNKITRTH